VGLGYDISFNLQGTLIILNVWTVNQDESVWKDPKKFIPDRFISNDGNLINTEKILSFGIGKFHFVTKN